MSAPNVQLLVDALARPEMLPGLRNAQWDLLIRQGRRADMLPRIEERCRTAGVWEQLPAQPRLHLESAAVVARRQHRELRWEVRLIADALASLQIPVALLKGAAYAMSGLAAARGRMMSDVDILVPHETLPEVESALMKRGWVSSAKTDYDDRYYRQWMHELPPMQHFHRQTVIDVHHAILPLTSRTHPSTARLLAEARPMPGDGRLLVLSPLDMVLHSASHLFHEGELEQGFRGLVDIDCLLGEFGKQADFWNLLVPRAIELELSRPLFYALRYAKAILGTAIPGGVLEAVAASPGGRASGPGLAMLDAMFLRALLPDHPTTSDLWTPTSRFMLYLRGHWLRMPPTLLAIHLGRKLLTRKSAGEAETA
jgi:hypothetical protein